MSAVFFFSSRRRHTRWPRDWSSDVCSSDLWIVQGLTLFACGALADRAFRRTGSAPRSRVLPAGALLILGAFFLYLAINIQSTLGAVIFFILSATAGAAIPLLGAIVLDVAPQAHRGFFQ